MNNPILDIGALKSPEIMRLLRAKYDKLNNETQRNFRHGNDVHSICQSSLLIQDLHLVYCGNKRTKQDYWGDGGTEGDETCEQRTRKHLKNLYSPRHHIRLQ